MFNIPLKKVHWFRRTFKILYRDEGVDEKAIDALVGHAEGDASRKAYAGVEYLDVLRCCVEISIRGSTNLHTRYTPSDTSECYTNQYISWIKTGQIQQNSKGLDIMLHKERWL